MIRRAPPELLGDFEAQRFRAFGVVRPDVDVDKRPLKGIGYFGAEPVDIIVVPLDPDDVRVVDTGADDFTALEVRGNKDKSAKVRFGAIRRDGARQISCRGAGHRVETQLTR